MSTINERTHAWNNALSVNAGTLNVLISPDEIIGSIPHIFNNTRLLSNGPGWNKYESGVIHPFDGHGYLRSIKFVDGSVSCRAEFIETDAYKQESKSNAFEIRGFATNPSTSFWRNIGFGTPRNVANTTIYRWNNQLLAGWEGGSPHAIDAFTLETIGIETFNGLIENKTTLAHMCQDPLNKRLIIANTTMGKSTSLTFHELDSNSQLMCSNTGELEGSAFVHDFTITKNWYVVGGNPLSIDYFKAGKAFLGSGTMLTSVKANTRKRGEIVLISRTMDGVQRRIQLPKPVFVVHFANAFERTDGTVVVDACIFHDFPFGEEFGYCGRDNPYDPTLPEIRGPQTLYRITIPPDATEGSWQKLTHFGVDFPRVLREYTGQDAPYMVGASRADPNFSDPFDSLFYLNLQTPDATPQLWTTNDTTFVGEPIPVHDPETDKHYVVVMLTDGHNKQNTLNIFGLPDIARGPICQIPLPFMPLAFHGEWDSMGSQSPHSIDR